MSFTTPPQLPHDTQAPYNMPVGEGVYLARQQAIGLVYETYSFVAGSKARPGVSIILSNGTDLSGFSAEEADQFLLPLGDTGLRYQFVNVGKLHQDYAAGLFTQAMHHAQVAHIAYKLANEPAPPRQ